jgi:spermidine synthase
MSRSSTKKREQVALFAAAILVAIGGIIYELILGAAASYLVGDSILSFSLATGVTLFGMGIGSLLVNYIKLHPATSFATNEIILGLIGGNSVMLMYLGFVFTRSHWLIFAVISLAIGICIGLEIPLLMKMFQEFGRKSSVKLFSKILALDYFGALIASLLFPLVMLPYLGLMRSAYLVAALNIGVAVLILKQMKASKIIMTISVIATMLLLGFFIYATEIEHGIDKRTYKDPVMWQQQTPYQKIVLTRYKNDTRLFLNRNLQFSSLDEARYHETLSTSALSSVANPKRVLIMGGGDGLLARDVLKYPSVEHITLVDIDETMTNLAKTNHLLTDINQRSLHDPRVSIVKDECKQNNNDKYDNENNRRPVNRFNGPAEHFLLLFVTQLNLTVGVVFAIIVLLNRDQLTVFRRASIPQSSIRHQLFRENLVCVFALDVHNFTNSNLVNS